MRHHEVLKSVVLISEVSCEGDRAKRGARPPLAGRPLDANNAWLHFEFRSPSVDSTAQMDGCALRFFHWALGRKKSAPGTPVPFPRVGYNCLAASTESLGQDHCSGWKVSSAPICRGNPLFGAMQTKYAHREFLFLCEGFRMPALHRPLLSAGT